MSKILFHFTYNDPNNVGIWPPSIESSSWLSSLQSWLQTNEIGTGAIIFDSEAEMHDWLAAHKLTDATLLADLNAWKTAHNITLSSKYYTLTDASGFVNIVD